MTLQKYNHIRSKKYTQAAKGQPCNIKAPVCIDAYPHETTVFCHSNMGYHGKSTGCKADDIAGADGCGACHDFVDGRHSQSRLYTQEEREWYLMRGMAPTMKNRIDREIVKL